MSFSDDDPSILSVEEHGAWRVIVLNPLRHGDKKCQMCGKSGWTAYVGVQGLGDGLYRGLCDRCLNYMIYDSYELDNEYPVPRKKESQFPRQLRMLWFLSRCAICVKWLEFWSGLDLKERVKHIWKERSYVFWGVLNLILNVVLLGAIALTAKKPWTFMHFVSSLLINVGIYWVITGVGSIFTRALKRKMDLSLRRLRQAPLIVTREENESLGREGEVQ